MSTDLSLDIETISTKHNALVLSIGMCWFDKNHPDESIIPLPIVYPSLDQHASHVDAQTVRWWMNHGDSAKSVFSDSVEEQRVPLSVACVTIMEAVRDADRIWAKDPDFDCIILSRFLDSYGPRGFKWPFWKNRSVRTMLDVVPSTKGLVFDGTRHDALADAVHQAKQMQACFSHLRLLR